MHLYKLQVYSALKQEILEYSIMRIFWRSFSSENLLVDSYEYRADAIGDILCY